MRYWTDIRLKLEDQITVANQLLLLTLGAYVFIMVEEHRRWKIPIMFVGLLSWFLFRNKQRQSMVWIAFFALLSIDLYHNYFWVANHHFMVMFLVLSVISFNFHKRKDIFLKNIQILMVIVLFTSVVQKLMSSQFMSGDFYYFMTNRGYLFGKFIDFFPEKIELIRTNTKSISDLTTSNPNLGEHVVLKDIIPNLGTMSFAFAWITVITELVVGIVLLIKPKGLWTHILFALMIIGILCTRLETGFMALLAICGLYLSENFYLRLAYVMIAITTLILIVTKLGYH